MLHDWQSRLLYDIRTIYFGRYVVYDFESVECLRTKRATVRFMRWTKRSPHFQCQSNFMIQRQNQSMKSVKIHTNPGEIIDSLIFTFAALWWRNSTENIFVFFFFCSFSSLVHTHYTHSLKLEAWLFSRRLTVTQASNLFSVCGWKMLIIQLVIRPFSPKTYNSIDFFPRSTDAHIIYQQPWSICCAQIYIYLSIFSHKLN